MPRPQATIAEKVLAALLLSLGSIGAPTVWCVPVSAEDEAARAEADVGDERAAKDATIVQALLRLENIDIHSNPKLADAVLRHLERVEGTTEFLRLMQRFRLRQATPRLVDLILDHPRENLGVGAATLLLEMDETPRLRQLLRAADPMKAASLATTLGLVGDRRAVELLEPLLTDESLADSLRNDATLALGKSLPGERVLLRLVVEKRLPKQLEFATANSLFDSADPEVRREAAERLKLPETADDQPLPPLTELVRRRGRADVGRELFHGKATCGKCHKVHGQGKDVGPDLSEIGTKLSREALLVSVLDPAAAISHNYESYSIFLDDGNVVSGIVVSQGNEEISVRTAEAIDKTFRRDEIEEMVKQKTSLMPADLQKLLTVEELLHVIEYLESLRKE